MTLERRAWVPGPSETRVQSIAGGVSGQGSAALAARIEALADESRRIHECECFNLNPATNVMNPRAEALLASGLGTRASLGYPGAKYETGLEAIEEIEVIAARLAAEVLDARFVELRVPSGAMANLYGFMALCEPGDTIIAPPAAIGGHVTHHADGCAGLYRLNTVPAPVAADGYTIDVAALRVLAREVRPRLITVGGSLNLFEHPVAALREVADDVGAHLMFDAAHQCGIIAGKAWADPLAEGAHLMTMSTYKSLGGPPGGLIVTNDAGIAERLDSIAYPGMTANFDVAKTAALAMTLLDWRDHGRAYARAMIEVAQSLAAALAAEGLAVFAADQGFTMSHQFALEAAELGGGQAGSLRLREAGFLTCGIGLPLPSVPGDLNGLRIGTPEIVRFGIGPQDAPRMARLIARGLREVDRAPILAEVSEWRKGLTDLHFINR